MHKLWSAVEPLFANPVPVLGIDVQSTKDLIPNIQVYRDIDAEFSNRVARKDRKFRRAVNEPVVLMVIACGGEYRHVC